VDKILEGRKAAQEQCLAMAFLVGSNCNQHEKLLEDLENDNAQGQDKNCLKTVTAVCNLLINWKQNPKNIMRIILPANDGVSFPNVDGKGDCELALSQH
jgi:hypothetical protein